MADEAQTGTTAGTTTADTGTTTQTGTQTTGTTQTTGQTTDTGTQTQTGTTTGTETKTDTTTTAADWRSSITDPELKELATRFATPADAVKSAADFRKANSAMTKIPGKDATPEERAKFNKAIGAGENADAYKFELGREPTEADKVIQNNLARVAFENGVPVVAMSALSKAVTELATAQKAEENRVAVAAREANEAALRKEWGADYEANKTLATRAVQAFGEIKSHPEVVEFFDKTMVNGQKLGDHPVMIRMLGNIGRRMGEGEFIGAVGSDQRQSLQTELNQIMRDNPPGSAKYASREVQTRVTAIHEALAGNGGIVGQGGRSA
jgi:hypothetical protein